MDLYSTKLGSTPQKRNDMIAQVMTALAPLNLDSHSGDVLGDAYEYLSGVTIKGLLHKTCSSPFQYLFWDDTE